MSKEIERKFLLLNDDWKECVSHSFKIKQGYLFRNETLQARVRIIDGEKALFTIKTPTLNAIERNEYEYEIPLEDGLELFLNCGENFIEKTRYEVVHNEKKWEIDVFENHLTGLIYAEIELSSIKEEISKPHWVGEEITGNKNYSNSRLAFEKKKKMPKKLMVR